MGFHGYKCQWKQKTTNPSLIAKFAVLLDLISVKDPMEMLVIVLKNSIHSFLGNPWALCLVDICWSQEHFYTTEVMV